MAGAGQGSGASGLLPPPRPPCLKGVPMDGLRLPLGLFEWSAFKIFLLALILLGLVLPLLLARVLLASLWSGRPEASVGGRELVLSSAGAPPPQYESRFEAYHAAL